MKNLHLHNNQLASLPKINNLIQLQYLNFSYNRLILLPEMNNLIQLKYLVLNNNQLILLPEMNNLIQLKYLNLGYNQLILLPEMNNLIQLKYLHLDYNQLTSLPEMNNLIKLETLYLNYNQLTSLPEMNNLIKLNFLNLCYNQLTSLPEMNNLIKLNFLNLDYNQLTSLPEMNNLIRLETLYLNYNQLTSLPLYFINYRNLRYFEYSNNPIEYIPPQLLRILNKTTQKIYSDKQSVHNHSIQKGIQKSIEYIFSVKPNLKNEEMKQDILTNIYLDNESKSLIFEYIESKEVHSILNITFEELLLNVYSMILSSKDKEEIFKIMNSEIKDSNCKCFTGRLSRLVNCLNGFDENIKINISDNEQIGNIILLIREKYPLIDDLDKVKEEVRKELSDRGYSAEVIDSWVEYIE